MNKNEVAKLKSFYPINWSLHKDHGKLIFW